MRRIFAIFTSLQTNGRLMELSHSDGKLKVHYSERLVTLIREVRQLAALGFTIPKKIQSTADVANKFYRHGVVLKQVRIFINDFHFICCFVNINTTHHF